MIKQKYILFEILNLKIAFSSLAAMLMPLSEIAECGLKLHDSKLKQFQINFYCPFCLITGSHPRLKK
jgi:hypothetical protein